MSTPSVIQQQRDLVRPLSMAVAKHRQALADADVSHAQQIEAADKQRQNNLDEAQATIEKFRAEYEIRRDKINAKNPNAFPIESVLPSFESMDDPIATLKTLFLRKQKGFLSVNANRRSF